ncbi:transcription factor MYB97-like [Phalaenopsis equestris]|uniref:transcription factor MYB97-like n=1 Tax=Phalaenopsis equestris TaxID=78828 RepID=UPI0009E3E676|nr:transcription factor MYB97-like [Phalaenopsis equestris]
MQSGGGIPAMAALRKGPWLAEEDEILREYVKNNGPGDWSSIRSKGLLPRTGKSCRLRWVNKLKPHLKSGCKFSPEEERVVIDLQATFGNKWARIATYLPGRTDNDVKNFWSTRQKRLARLLQTPLPVKSQKRQERTPLPPEMPNFEPNVNSGVLLYNPPCSDFIPFTEQYSNIECSPEQMINLDPTTPHLEPAIINSELCVQSSSAPQSPFNHPLLDLPPLPEGQDLIPEFDDMSFLDQFDCEESSQALQLTAQPTFFDMDVGCPDIKMDIPGTPESIFGDFPADMFD